MNKEQAQPTEPTIEARRKCAEWLASCLDFGWNKTDLDGLEKVWWQFHDNNGKLIAGAQWQSSQTPELTLKEQDIFPVHHNGVDGYVKIERVSPKVNDLFYRQYYPITGGLRTCIELMEEFKEYPSITAYRIIEATENLLIHAPKLELSQTPPAIPVVDNDISIGSKWNYDRSLCQSLNTQNLTVKSVRDNKVYFFEKMPYEAYGIEYFKDGKTFVKASMDVEDEKPITRHWTDEDMIDFHNFIFRHTDQYKKMGEYLQEFISQLPSPVTPVISAEDNENLVAEVWANNSRYIPEDFEGEMGDILQDYPELNWVAGENIMTMDMFEKAIKEYANQFKGTTPAVQDTSKCNCKELQRDTIDPDLCAYCGNEFRS